MHDYAPTEVSSDGSAPYTEHVEPIEQGGEKYVKCEGCSRELLLSLGGRDKLVHRRDCPNVSPDRRTD